MSKIIPLFRALSFLVLSSILVSANASSKSDLAKEKRWEEQVVPSLMVGEDVHLNAAGVEFLALYAEPETDKAKGAVIILHGIGVHPAWGDVIEPLRTQLPESGWHTLSLQMPVLHNKATDVDYSPLFPEVPVRIQAGVDFLKSKGIRNIVLTGHSLGVAMGASYLSTTNDAAVKGFMMLGGGYGVPNDPLADMLANFKKIKNINIVDVYGSEDRKPIMEMIEKRKVLGKQVHGKRYQLLQIKGANHFYNGKDAELVKDLNAWLDKNMLH